MTLEFELQYQSVAFYLCAGNHGAAMADPPVEELLGKASGGDQGAWDELVDRFGGLVWSVARGCRLDPATAADVSQTVWLRLVENIDSIRQPESLAGWLATTARREAWRLTQHKQRYVPTVVVETMVDPVFVDPATELLRDERAATVTSAFLALSEDCQQLLRLVISDPPLEYAQISGIIDRPIGSIGPTRNRCLEQLRRRLAGIEPGEAQSQVGTHD